jgi:rhodanese-related sulfurtransferase
MKYGTFLGIMIILCAVWCTGCTDYGGPTQPTATEGVPGYTDVSVEEANAMASRAPTLVVDVSPIWGQGHIPGAVNMPLATLDEEIQYLSRDREYLIYCHTDAASIEGAETFAENGFSPVYRLEGNYRSWTNAGYPVEMPHYMNVSAADLNTAMKELPYLVVVDVSPVYLEGHIAGAVSIQLQNLEDALPTLDKAGEYAIYCHSDEASIQGAQMFVDAGFNPVWRLEGNYQAWVDAGYPVEVGFDVTS